MARVRQLTLAVFPGWSDSPDLLPAVRSLFEFDSGEDRATGGLLGDGKEWPTGSDLLADLQAMLRVRFTHIAYQAYRNGSGCDWHADTPWDVQAILSLGATRTFGIRRNGGVPEWLTVSHGDLVFMQSGFQDTHEHCVPVEPDKPGERISLVFRTPRS